MANFEEQGIKLVNITFSKVVLITCHQTRQITFWRRKCGNGILLPKLFWPSVRKNWSNDPKKLLLTCHEIIYVIGSYWWFHWNLRCIWCLTISNWMSLKEWGIIKRVYLLFVWIRSKIWLFRECIIYKSQNLLNVFPFTSENIISI